MEVIKNKITVKFSTKEKEIITQFMSIVDNFSKECKDNDFIMNCSECPFSNFCDTFANDANDVENYINQKINI